MKQSILNWEGWEMVGAIAGVLSLIAIVVALREVFLQRRAVHDVIWGLDLWGSFAIDGDTYHTADLYNAGTDTADIINAWFINARPYQVGEARFRSIMAAGDRVQVNLTAESIETAWFFVIWRNHSEAKRLHYKWLPVAGAGAMSEAFDASWERTNKPRLSRIRKRLTVRPVGPGYFTYSTNVSGRDVVKNRAKVEIAVHPLGAFDQRFSWGYPRDHRFPNFPYVPLP